jgi:hypothetical protein
MNPFKVLKSNKFFVALLIIINKKNFDSYKKSAISTRLAIQTQNNHDSFKEALDNLIDFVPDFLNKIKNSFIYKYQAG